MWGSGVALLIEAAVDDFRETCLVAFKSPSNLIRYFDGHLHRTNITLLPKIGQAWLAPKAPKRQNRRFNQSARSGANRSGAHQRRWRAALSFELAGSRVQAALRAGCALPVKASTSPNSISISISFP